MISDLILTTYNDRAFCILTTITCYVCMSGNIRAFHKRIAHFTSEWTNDVLVWIGFLAIFGLPLVGLFDEINFHTLHVICAGVFFGGFGIYALWLTSILKANKDKFTLNEQKAIDWQVTVTNTIVGLLVVFIGLMVATGETQPYGPWLEWLYVFSLLNYFMVLSYDNDFYDCVKWYGNVDA